MFRTDHLIYVMLGSSLGGGLRYLVNVMLSPAAAVSRLPWATLTVNIVGCFLIGLALGAIDHRHIFSQEHRLFLVTGVLGGFTTFSAFGHELWSMLQHQQLLIAFLYLMGSVFGGVLAVWLGWRCCSI